MALLTRKRLVLVKNEPAETGTAQAGSSTTITLASAESAVDNFYAGLPITLTAGTGSGQTAIIASYVGSTKVATIQGTFSTPPDNTSVYSISGGTYGIDSSPVVGTNALLVSNLEVTPLNAETVERTVIRPYLGNYETLVATKSVQVTLTVEAQSTGAAGIANPPAGLDALLRACGFSVSSLTSAHTGTAQAGTSSTITLASSASAVDNAYRGMRLRFTNNTPTGVESQTAIIKSYVGNTKVATIHGTFTTTPSASSTYSIDAHHVYSPVSQGFESATVYCNVDGIQHIIKGCCGNVVLNFNVGEIPTFEFTLTGLYTAPTDTALGTPTYSQIVPEVVNASNSGEFRFFDYVAPLMSVSVDMASDVQYRELIGLPTGPFVRYSDRRPTIELSIEAPTIAQKNYFDACLDSSTLGNFTFRHGTAAGKRIIVQTSRVDLTEGPTYSDDNGTTMLNLNGALVPSDTGNDELTIAFA